MRPVAVVGLLAVLACTDEPATTAGLPADVLDDYAAARCGAMFRCDCPAVGFVDVAMCIAELHARHDASIAALRERTEGYDAACLDAVLAYWQGDAPCRDPFAVGVDPTYCSLVTGDGEIGDACAATTTHSFSASSCAPGLYCDGGTQCRAAPDAVSLPLGADCVDVAAGARCDDGLYCDATAGRCAAELALGSPCAQSDACAAAALCAGLDGATAGTCTAPAMLGEICEATAPWDPRPCAKVLQGETLAASYCVAGQCLPPVPDACGPWL